MRRRILTILLIVIAVVALWLAVPTPQAAPTPSITPSPTQNLAADFVVDQCVKVTRPTNLRFGPGMDYPVFTNIPVRSQPRITIIDNPSIGFTCLNSTACQPYIEGWWWPVELIWLDTGDVDRGWLSQNDLKPCV